MRPPLGDPGTLRRAARFLVVAGAGTVCDVCAVTASRSAGLPLVVAVSTGWLTSLAVGFTLNRVWVFEDAPSEDRLGTAWRYGLLGALNAVVAILGVSGAVALGVPYLAARITASVCMTALNYVVCRYWVFRTRSEHGPTPTASKDRPLEAVRDAG